MRDTDYKSLRREFLGVGLTGAMVGLAGCSDSVNVETGSDDDTEESNNQSPDLESVELSFSYNAAEQQATIEFVGGANIKAGNVRVQQGSETQVSWAELGSTTSNPDQNISPGATAVLGENILNWGQPVAEDDLIRVVYTGGETPATLERYSPPESTDSESTVPASISGFTLESSGEQQLQVSFDSSKQLGTIEVDITGAESATLARTEFTESASGDSTFSYSASYEASSDGSYTAEITRAADTDGTNALNGENISDTANINTQEQSSDTTPPSISAFSISNPSGQQLRISFDSTEQLSTIQVTINGGETVVLSTNDFDEMTANESYTYEASYQFDSYGHYTATLDEASDENNNNGASNQSVSVLINTESFEDGDLSQYTGDLETFTIQSDIVQNGQNAIKAERSQRGIQAISRLGSGSSPSKVQGYLRNDSPDSESAKIRVSYWNDEFEHRNGEGKEAFNFSCHMNADTIKINDGGEYNTTFLRDGEIQGNTWYFIELTNLDWNNHVIGSVYIDGTEVASDIQFANNINQVDRVVIECNSVSGGIIGYADDITLIP